MQLPNLIFANISRYTVIYNALDLPPTYSSWLNLPPLDTFPERNPAHAKLHTYVHRDTNSIHTYACMYVCTHICMYVCTYVHTHTMLEIRSKWWTDKCPSIIILGQTISDSFGQTLGIPMTWYHHCVCVSNKHLGSAQPNV